MSKYKKITVHLNSLNSPEWRASFSDLEDILGFSLPVSARRYTAWWANDHRHGRQSSAWLSAGWTVADLNLTGETVTFQRVCHGAEEQVGQNPKQRREPQRSVEPDMTAQNLPVAPGLNPLELSVSLTWRTLGRLCEKDRILVFPNVPDIAGLYRFRLINDGTSRHYIGETARLRRRFAHYRKPGPSQTTNIRINALLLEHLAAGDEIEIDILTTEASLQINDHAMVVDFSDKATRRLFEQAAIVAEGGTDIESLNR